MTYGNTHRVTTPEGVTLDLTLAGIGSRGTAALIDVVIQGAALFALSRVASGAVGVVVEALAGFAVIFGYHFGFEAAGGRTPGKMAVSIRVVGVDGGPTGVFGSAARNLVRLVDFLPAAYIVGMLVAMMTERGQRLGDLAAGTLVVAESRRTAVTSAALPPISTALATESETWDVSRVSDDDVAAIRSFFDRETTLSTAARSSIVDQLTAKIRPKVRGVQRPHDPVQFLSALVRRKAGEPRSGG